LKQGWTVTDGGYDSKMQEFVLTLMNELHIHPFHPYSSNRQGEAWKVGFDVLMFVV
jgi:hypothetical protein